MKQVTAIVPAAGKGSRLGHGTNKPFSMLMDKPIVLWALMALHAVDEIKEIIPVLKSRDMEQGLELLKRHSLSKIKNIAVGGNERQDSVFSGLRLVSKGTDIVVIHDGARPLVEKSLIQNAINRLNDYDGVIAATPVNDTIKESDDDTVVVKTLRRRNLWSVQTPQVFRYSSIMNAYEKAMQEGFYSTDDAALVERYGGRVKVVMGSYKNIKITTTEDIDIAEMFLRGGPFRMGTVS